MDLNHLLMETDVTLAMLVIVAFITALVLGVWELVKSLSSRNRVIEETTSARDMRTLNGVRLEAGA